MKILVTTDSGLMEIMLRYLRFLFIRDRFSLQKNM